MNDCDVLRTGAEPPGGGAERDQSEGPREDDGARVPRRAAETGRGAAPAAAGRSPTHPPAKVSLLPRLKIFHSVRSISNQVPTLPA